MSNVTVVKSDFKKQEAEVYFTGHLDQETVNMKIQSYGYEIGDRENNFEVKEPMSKKLLEAFLIATGIALIYLIAKELNIIPSINITGSLNLLTVLFLGLVASVSTCMATSGALFLSTIGKKTNNLKQAIFFSLGRIISYGFFGFIAGLIGSVIITNFKFGSALTLLAAVFMVLLGLDMLKILSFASIVPFGVSSNAFRKLEHFLIKDPHKSAFILGMITYFLPCGFTQATQVYALGLASPWQSALTMAIFALGTAPAIIFIGSLKGLLKSSFYQYFMKIVAVGVLILGLYYASNFLSIYGINLGFAKVGKGTYSDVKTENGKQIINMAVVGSGYTPNYFTVKKGIPVKWVIDGKNVFGCQGYFIVPTLGVSKALSEGENIIEFTPKESGFINFSCGMGMYRGRIEVIN
jgi:sulfite exporter TauE/SafE